MLTKQCKNVLKNLIILSDNSDAELCFLYGYGKDPLCICRSDNYDLCYDYSKYQKEIHSIIDQLVMDNYAVYTESHNFFCLTQKALQEKQFIFGTIKNIAIKEVLIPAAVSMITAAATTFITLWISGLKLPWQ